MTDEELAAIEARAQAATPGPWSIRVMRGFGTQGTTAAHIQSPAGDVVSNGNYGEGGYVWRLADAQFIIHARAEMPMLLAEVRRLEGLRVMLIEEREAWEAEAVRLRAIEEELRISIENHLATNRGLYHQCTQLEQHVAAYRAQDPDRLSYDLEEPICTPDGPDLHEWRYPLWLQDGSIVYECALCGAKEVFGPDEVGIPEELSDALSRAHDATRDGAAPAAAASPAAPPAAPAAPR